MNLFCSFRNFPKIYLINFVFYRITASLVFFFVLTGRAFADPILGDAGAAWSTADATQVNPANGAFLDRTQGTGSLELLRNESLDRKSVV